MQIDLIIIAGGDSLRGFDWNILPDDIPIWVINHACCHVPRYDAIFALDGRMPNYPKDFPINTKKNGDRPILPIDIEWKRNRISALCREPGTVGGINHSPFFAINAALNKGFRDIFVLGCDQRGNRHFYDPIETHEVYNFHKYDICFGKLARDLRPEENITLVESACEHFPRMSLEEFKKSMVNRGSVFVV